MPTNSAPTSTTSGASPTPLEESGHLLGLLRFKVGAGGEAVEYVGVWDFPLNRLLHKAFDVCMSRR